MTDKDRKRYQSLANRNRRALLREKEQYGYYDDGGGKRYRIGVYYVLAGSPSLAQEYYAWYAKTFADDCGEPICFLYWALAEHRCANEAAANRALMNTMLSNLYLLPFLFGKPVAMPGIQHHSNRECKEYLSSVSEYLDEPTAAERSWIEATHDSQPFTQVREFCIHTLRLLTEESDIKIRSKVLRQWDKAEAEALKSL